MLPISGAAVIIFMFGGRSVPLGVVWEVRFEAS